MPRIVINTSYGALSLSSAQRNRLVELLGETPEWAEEIIGGYGYYPNTDELRRDNPALVTLAEEMPSANWKIVEVPDGVDRIIQDYDGKEWVAETHRTWR